MGGGEVDDEEAPTAHSSTSGGLSLAVPKQNTTPTHTPSDPPVAALRRYLDSMPQHPSPRREVVSGVVWRCVRGELIASFLLTVVSTAAAVQPAAQAPSPPCAQPLSVGAMDDIVTETGWGWAVRWAIGHGVVMGALSWAVRSAHISPPTSIALLVSRKVSLLRALLHIIAQILGALLASPVLLGLLPRSPRPPQLQPHLTAIQGWGAEFLATLFVTLITLSAYESTQTPSRYTKDTQSDTTTPKFAPSSAIPIIAAHTGAALFSADFTGVGLNPARSLAVAIVTGDWRFHWVFWVGPSLGGLLAAFTHEYTGAKDHANSSPQHPPPPLISRDTSRPSAITSTLASPC